MINFDFREDDVAYIINGLYYTITKLQGYLQEAQKEGYYTLPGGKQVKCDDNAIKSLANELTAVSNMYGYVNYKVMMGGNKKDVTD